MQRFFLLVCLLLGSTSIFADKFPPKENEVSVTYKGIVMDEHGEPLAGVRVYIQQSGKEVFTDFKGRFNIQASTSDIRFDYPGKKGCTRHLQAARDEAPILNKVILFN